jgi:hypothetical protein
LTDAIGPHTIGPSGKYPDFANALDSLAILGVRGAVTFDILSGTYNLTASDLIIIPPVAGASVDNVVTFRSETGVPSEVTLAHGGVSMDDAFVIMIDGADWINIQDLTIAASGADYAQCIRIAGAADSINITNNVLTAPATAYANREQTATVSIMPRHSLHRPWMPPGHR